MPSPTARGRKLAAELRARRNDVGLTTRDAASSLGWNQSKISRIETGHTTPTVADVERILELYGATERDLAAVKQLARDARKRGWYVPYEEEGVFGSTYVALEDDARRIEEWAPQLVPGILQTESYAREVIRSGCHDPSDVDRRVQARMVRKTLLGRENAPALSAVIDESVLRRPLGGVDVLLEQLHSLVAATRRPNIEIQLMPLAVGTHPGLDGPFILLTFEDHDPPMGYTEGMGGPAILESIDEVERLRVTYDSIRKAALSVDESAARIAAMTKESSRNGS